MRPLVTLFLLVFVLAVFFAAVGAAGVWGLRRQQVTLAPPPAHGPVINDDADADPVGDALPAGGRVRGVPSPAPRDPFADDRGPGRPPPLPAVPPPLPPKRLPPPLPPPAGPFDLSALNAITHGREIRVEAVTGGFAVSEWRDPQAYVEWMIGPRAPGWYSVELSFACAEGAGGSFVVAIANQTLTGRARPTGGWGNYQVARLGNVHLAPDEETRLELRPDGDIASILMNVRGLRLVPAP